MSLVTVYNGDSRDVMKNFPDGYFDLIVTSPPYADMRDGQYDGCKPENFVKFMYSFQSEFWRILSHGGSLVINIKDGYESKCKSRYAWKMIEAYESMCWKTIDDYVWVKSDAMPNICGNRLRNAWEYCFHLAKEVDVKFYPDNVKQKCKDTTAERTARAINKNEAEHISATGSGRSIKRASIKDMVLPDNVLRLATESRNTGHPAAFPVGIPEFFIKLLTKEGDRVLDPFAGSGTTGFAAVSNFRNCVLIEKEKRFIKAIESRLNSGKYPYILK